MISSFCQDGGCVDVSKVDANGYIHVTRSDDPYGSFFTLAEWDAFVQGVKNGEFDREKLSGGENSD